MFRTCRVCRARVIAGLDAEWCALLAIADPEPLSPELELEAMLEGRRTYRLSYARDGEPLVIDYRDRWGIAGYPAGGAPRHSRPYSVIAEHRCPGALG